MKTLKDLLLALINATLILVALCLFLVLMITQSAERTAERFTDVLSNLAPVRDRVEAVETGIAGLRSDVQALSSASSPTAQAAALRLQSRMDSLETALTGVQAELARLNEVPDQVITTGIDHTADRISGAIQSFRSCTPEGEV